MKETLIETIESYKKGEINKSTMLLIIEGCFLLVKENADNVCIEDLEDSKNVYELIIK
jgi:hypothetical protein